MKYLFALIIGFGLVGCGGDYVTQDTFRSTTTTLRADIVKLEQQNQHDRDCRFAGDVAVLYLHLCDVRGLTEACLRYEEIGEAYDAECLPPE